jgi:exodeoxyribonuclease-3
VLTETKTSTGCQLLADAFTAAGCLSSVRKPTVPSAGWSPAACLPQPAPFGQAIGYLPSSAAATVALQAGPLRIGMYVSSRDASAERSSASANGSACHGSLSGSPAVLPTVLLSDLYVVEPGHRPHYRLFVPFEYGFYRALLTEHVMTDLFGTCTREPPSTAG